MTLLKTVLLILAAGLVLATALGLWVRSRDRAQALRRPETPGFDPAMVADLPDGAQRYFTRTIAPGTPLQPTVRLVLAGRCILNGSEMPLAARQILAPLDRGLVWEHSLTVQPAVATCTLTASLYSRLS